MKKFLFLLVSAVMAMSASALTARDAFVTAPRDVIAAIDSITRLDMLDYFASGSSVASRNAFGGDAMVKSLSDGSITVGTSVSSEVTIALLPAGRDTMLLVINTLALPVPDSKATVYNRDWTLAAGKVQLSSHNDLDRWLTPEAKQRRAEIENAIPFVSAIYAYGNGELTVTNTLARLLPADDYALVKSYLKPANVYRWTGKKWSEVKK